MTAMLTKQHKGLALTPMALSAKQQDTVDTCLPGAQLFEDTETGLFYLARTPDAILESFNHKGILFGAIAKVHSTYTKEQELAHKYGAKVLTEFDEFYSNKTVLTYQCMNTDCGHTWKKAQYLQRARITTILKQSKVKPTYKKRLRSLIKSHPNRLMCPKCFEQYIRVNYLPIPLTQRLKVMTDEDLLLLAKTTFSAMQMQSKDRVITQQDFNSKHGAFYEEMRKRNPTQDGTNQANHLFDELSRFAGWRRKRPELDTWTINEYKTHLTNLGIKTMADWRKIDVHSLKKATDRGFKDELKAWLNPKFLADGVFYDSYAEFIVAKVLAYNNIAFKAHSDWPFTYKSRCKMKKDFDFNYHNQHFSVEVLMITEQEMIEEEISDSALLSKYIERSKYKLAKISQLTNTQLITIRARKLKHEDVENYLSHIFDVFEEHNIVLNRCGIHHLDLAPTNFENWEIKTWMTEAKNNGWQQLTDLPPVLQNHLRKNKTLQLQLHEYFCHLTGKKFNTRFKLAPLEVFEAYILKRPELWSKPNYDHAYNKNELPLDFPAEPHAAYNKSLFEIIADGPRIANYFEAKALVQTFNLTSKDDFIKKRASTDLKYRALKRIRACPQNLKSGGYAEFEDWPTFLGNERLVPWRDMAGNQTSIEILKHGTVDEVVDLIKDTFKVKTRGELRKINSTIINILDQRIDCADIDIKAFGLTYHLIYDIDTVFNSITPIMIKSEDDWQRTRHTDEQYKKFPAKLQRLKPIESESWPMLRQYYDKWYFDKHQTAHNAW